MNAFSWRSRFMLMKADSWTKPGYTRRPAPACCQGTVLIRFFSNHSIGLVIASRLTLVGLMRQSIGPAMSVRLAGVAGCLSSAMSAAAASAATVGWHTARTWPPAPIASVNCITCSMYSSRPKRPATSATSRTLSQSVT